MIPVRCFTCGAVISDRWDAYVRKVRENEDAKAREGAASKPGGKTDGDAEQVGGSVAGKENMDPMSTAKILDDLDLTRLCCRRHFLANVEMMDDL